MGRPVWIAPARQGRVVREPVETLHHEQRFERGMGFQRRQARSASGVGNGLIHQQRWQTILVRRIERQVDSRQQPGLERRTGFQLNHLCLRRVSRAEQRQEIQGCARRLQAELGQPMTLFSYPFGFAPTFNDDTRACLREIGVKWAFSFYGSFEDFGSRRRLDPYDIPRLAVERDSGLDLFRAKVTLPRIFA